MDDLVNGLVLAGMFLAIAFATVIITFVFDGRKATIRRLRSADPSREPSTQGPGTRRSDGGGDEP